MLQNDQKISDTIRTFLMGFTPVLLFTLYVLTCPTPLLRSDPLLTLTEFFLRVDAPKSGLSNNLNE